MPASKPKSQHRKPIIVSCSSQQKQQIDKLIARYNIKNRSKYILGVLFETIALNDTEIGEKPAKHGKTVKFQISCTPKQYRAIVDFGNKIPHFKRSRWIVHQLLKSY